MKWRLKAILKAKPDAQIKRLRMSWSAHKFIQKAQKKPPQNKNVKVPNLLLFYYINYSDTFR